MCVCVCVCVCEGGGAILVNLLQLEGVKNF